MDRLIKASEYGLKKGEYRIGNGVNGYEKGCIRPYESYNTACIGSVRPIATFSGKVLAHRPYTPFHWSNTPSYWPLISKIWPIFGLSINNNVWLLTLPTGQI